MTDKQKTFEKMAASIIKSFEKRGIEGYFCPDGASAVEKALSLMPAGSSVGFGGSETLKETGMLDALKAGEYEIFDRSNGKDAAEVKQICMQAIGADYFLMSSNAITLDGELVNIDGTGNRVAALIWGPENVIILAGMNKIVADVKAGVDRVRNMAAPPNATRLNIKTPCGVTGKCEDCYSPSCMCCEFVITRKSKFPNRIKVILIGEEYGY